MTPNLIISTFPKIEMVKLPGTLYCFRCWTVSISDDNACVEQMIISILIKISVMYNLPECVMGSTLTIRMHCNWPQLIVQLMPDCLQWRIYIVKFWINILPSWSNFLQFHAVFGKFWRPSPFRVGAPLWEILDLPLVCIFTGHMAARILM